MSSAYEKLLRILSLECEQGCRNRAVIGGLGRFLRYWEREARNEESTSGGHVLTVAQVLGQLGNYDDLTPDQRRQAVTPLVAALDENAASPAPGSDAAAVAPTDDAATSGDDASGAHVDESQGTPSPDGIPSAAAAASEAAQAIAAQDKAQAERAGSPRADGVSGREPPAPRREDSRKRVASSAADGTTLSSSVTALRGVSTVSEKRLAKLGIATIRDLIYHFPRRYDDYASLKTINQLEYGDEVTVVGVVQRVRSQRTRQGRSVVRVEVGDGTATIGVTWFNQPFLLKRLRQGMEIVLSGRVDEYLGRLVFTSPEWEPLQRQLLHTGRLVPVYPLTAGLRARWLRTLIKRTLDNWGPRIVDPLPGSVRERVGAMDLGTALRQVHFPDDPAKLQRARQRLCFDEFLLLQLGVLQHRAAWRKQAGRAMAIPGDQIDGFVGSLPFELTGAQRRAIDDVLADLAVSQPMSRLLQGDVGSGKTVVALVAMLAAAHNGLQSALMAPTSILAQQHYRTLAALLGEASGVRCALLVGSMSAAEKTAVRDGLRSGDIQVVVGTHALIQESVAMDALGLVVVDEQHRFGVEQRSGLMAKGDAAVPHLLAMSATPIPRTLALTVYGDLDVTVLDEMPPGRQQIVTAVRDGYSRERIYHFMDVQIGEGRQAFVIYPLVEDSEAIDAKAAVSEHHRLQRDVFPHRRVGLLHGRMSADDKDAVMAEFSAGELDVLVSTSVVEVGIDVPNATVMLIEGADRFGLAQLHQFRGRVGRGQHKSYCILMSEDASEQAMERLKAMEATTDGFALAEKDLELRGPGDFFGVRQHGLPPLKVASLSDSPTLDQARREALRLYDTDPDLADEEHALLRMSVRHFWSAPGLN